MDGKLDLQCKECGRDFSSTDALKMHSEAKHMRSEKNMQGNMEMKKIKKFAMAAIILSAIIGISWAFSNSLRYEDPPYKFTGQPHPETYPPQQYMDGPIPIPVQVHILEHSPNGSPGGLAQYNCKKAEIACTEMAEKLKMLIKRIDSQSAVYVAPYDRVDALIVLTGRGKIDKLNDYDETKIIGFFSAIGID